MSIRNIEFKLGDLFHIALGLFSGAFIHIAALARALQMVQGKPQKHGEERAKLSF